MILYGRKIPIWSCVIYISFLYIDYLNNIEFFIEVSSVRGGGVSGVSAPRGVFRVILVEAGNRSADQYVPQASESVTDVPARMQRSTKGFKRTPGEHEPPRWLQRVLTDDIESAFRAAGIKPRAELNMTGTPSRSRRTLLLIAHSLKLHLSSCVYSSNCGSDFLFLNR